MKGLLAFCCLFLFSGHGQVVEGYLKAGEVYTFRLRFDLSSFPHTRHLSGEYIPANSRTQAGVIEEARALIGQTYYGDVDLKSYQYSNYGYKFVVHELRILGVEILKEDPVFAYVSLCGINTKPILERTPCGDL
jgi:hypothetical protein